MPIRAGVSVGAICSALRAYFTMWNIDVTFQLDRDITFGSLLEEQAFIL